MRRIAIPLYLLALMLYVLAGTPLAPFHGDESTLIYASRDYFDQFVARDLPSVMNQRDDTDAMDRNLRLLDGRVQKYLGGFAFHLTGGTADNLNKPWLWGADWQYNLNNGHIPARDLLMAQRWAMALLLALSVPVAYGIGAQVGGIPGGLLMATLIAVSPNLALNGRRAMMEAPLLLFSLLSALAALRIATSRQPPAASKGQQRFITEATEHTESTENRSSLGTWHSALLFLLFGAAAGMALASKHSGLFTVAPLFGALGLWMLWRRDWRGISKLVLAGLVSVAVFVAFNPAWWASPLETAREVLTLRSSLLDAQSGALGGYESVGQYVQGFIDYAVLETPQYYEVAEWQAWIGDEIAAYESSPWVLSPPLNAFRALIVAVFGLWGILVLIRRRDGVAWVAGIWILASVAAAFFLTPLPWARYYLIALPALYALAAAGCGALVAYLRR
jgi:4-amino-4-deoxy-L-arabinose transferase-like glycosyltransferase